MTFLFPTMLFGAFAAGVPIALHFFYRSRYRTVPWAAMRFLVIAVEETSRRLKFQELLLLAARVLLLVLLALAFARPTSSDGRSGGGEAVDAVMVIDTSMSMDARTGAKSRLDIAKLAAKRIVDRLPPHSTVQILTCADRMESLGPPAATDLQQAKKIIDEISITHLASDLLPAVVEASNILKKGVSANKEFYLFSDMHQLAWEAQNAGLKVKLVALHAQASICLVRCGTEKVRNVTLVDLSPVSPVPQGGELTSFRALIRNSGTELLRDLTVSLTLEDRDEPADAQPVMELRPGESRAVTLRCVLDEPGWRKLSAKVGPDDLPADNRVDQMILVRDQLRILVVDGKAEEADPARLASFFLLHGLLPIQDELRDRHVMHPTLVSPRQATPALLKETDLCVLANVPLRVGLGKAGSLSPEFVAALASFVKDGGGVLIFAGELVTADAYNSLLYEQHGLLPLKLRETGPAQKEVHPDRSSVKAGTLARFHEETYRPLNDVTIGRYFPLHEPAESPTQTRILMRLNDGHALLASRRVGQGEVLFVTTSADTTWTDWPIHRGMYVPWVNLLVGQMLQAQTQKRTSQAGDPISWQPSTKDAGRSWVGIDGQGRRESLGTVTAMGGDVSLLLPIPKNAGAYRVVDSSKPDDDNLVFAINPCLRETENLATLTEAEIDARLGFAPLHVDAENADGEMVVERVQQEWTDSVFLLALVVLAGQMVLAWFTGRAG